MNNSATIGDQVDMPCSVCELEQPHVIRAVTKGGKITQAVCSSCETATTFSRGIKTSLRAGNGKIASPYDRTRSYRVGQSMMHHVFGRGEVTAVLASQKIDVLFGETTRRMIHAQG